MIGVVAVLKAKEGSEKAFEEAFLAMAAAVKANEPGNLMYQLCKSRTEAGTYKVLEVYADDAAVEAHRTSDHYKAGGRSLRDLVAAPPEVELLDAVE
jgi:quinol monooxygenase YgiN